MYFEGGGFTQGEKILATIVINIFSEYMYITKRESVNTGNTCN